MKTLKDGSLSTLQNVYLFQKEYRFALTVLSGFTLDESPELLDDSELWDNIQDALGKKGVFDINMPKLQGEVVVVGRCFAPGEKPVSHLVISFQVGKIKKEVVVFGDRTWQKSAGVFKTMSNPEPFLVMDITWENAFGGSKYKKNPSGKGAEDIGLPSGETVRPLPNVEDPDKLIVSASDRPTPVCFAPMGLDWPNRLKKLGTFNKKWLKEDWPGYPDDYDFSYFNVAPEDQRIEDFWTGGEEIEVRNMHPEKASIRTKVPEIKPRSFINTVTEERESFEEIPLKMDTIWLLPNQNTGVAIWRGETVVSDDEASQVSHLVAFFEEKDEEPKPVAFYQNKLKEEPEEAELEALEAEGEAAEKAGIKFPGMAAAVPLTAAAAVTAAAKGKKPAEAEGEAAEGEEEAETGAARGEGEEPEEKEAEAAKGEGPEASPAGPSQFELTAEDQTQLKKIFAERGWDFDEIMAAREKSLKETPTEPQAQKDPYDIAGLDRNIINLERNEYERAMAAHFKQQGIDIGDPAADKELQNIKKKQLERIRNWKKILVDKGIDDPQVLAEFDKAEALTRQTEGPAESTEEAAPAEKAEIPDKEEKVPSAKESLQNKLDSGESLEGADLSGADLEGMDLKGCNLSGAILESVNLAEVNLEGVVLSGAILTRAVLSGAKLKGAKLSECSASNCNLAKADLSGADLSNADFYKADLSEAMLNGAVLKETNFGEAKMNKARCKGVQAEGAKFEGADLTGAVFQDANLKGADLSGACVDKTDFGKANLGGVRLLEVTGKATSFKDTDMHESRGDENTHINEADFSNANLSKVAWNEANFKGSNFTNADFSRGSVLKCNMANTNFHRIVAKNADFSKCDFSKASMVEANFFKGSLRKANLTEADLSDSNLYGVDFYKAVTQDTIFDNANLKKTLVAQSSNE
jgi:uncharacterized protein YjbI with pentapeptide repeats